MSEILTYGDRSAGKQYSRYLSIVQMYTLSPKLCTLMFTKQDLIRAHAAIINTQLKFYGEE